MPKYINLATMLQAALWIVAALATNYFGQVGLYVVIAFSAGAVLNEINNSLRYGDLRRDAAKEDSDDEDDGPPARRR